MVFIADAVVNVVAAVAAANLFHFNSVKNFLSCFPLKKSFAPSSSFLLRQPGGLFNTHQRQRKSLSRLLTTKFKPLQENELLRDGFVLTADELVLRMKLGRWSSLF